MLSIDHKQFIKSAVDYLFDFTPENLTDRWQAIVEALTKEVPESHEYYQFRKFLAKTEETLLRVEERNDPKEPEKDATLGEVQRGILEVALDNVRAVISDQSTINKLTAEIHELAKPFIPPKNFERKFKSIEKIPAPPQPVVVFPWIDMHLPNEIYTASLILHENMRDIFLFCSATILGSPYYFQEVFLIIPPGYEANYQQFLRKSMIEAFDRAGIIIKNEIILSLFNKGIIDLAVYQNALQNNAIFPILVNDYYLDLISNKIVLLENILNLDQKKIPIYANPTTVKLLRDNLISIEDAGYLTVPKLKFVDDYYPYLENSCLENKKLPLNCLNYISDKQASLFIIPTLFNLYKNNKINFEQLLQIPARARKLIKSNLYGEYFLKHPQTLLDLHGLEKKHRIFLLKPQIAALIKEGLITFQQAINFSEIYQFLLTQKKINELFLSKKITLDDLGFCTDKMAQLIEKDEMIYYALKFNIIKFDELIAGKDELIAEKVEDIHVKFFVAYFAKRLTSLPGAPHAYKEPDHFLRIRFDFRTALCVSIPNATQFLNKFVTNLFHEVINFIDNNDRDFDIVDNKFFKELKKYLNLLLISNHLTGVDKIYHLTVFANQELAHFPIEQKKYFTKNYSVTTNVYRLFSNGEYKYDESFGKMVCLELAKFSTLVSQLPYQEESKTYTLTFRR